MQLSKQSWLSVLATGLLLGACSSMLFRHFHSANLVQPQHTVYAADTQGIVPPVSVKRVQQVKNLRFGMWICWSFSTFSGKEWTPEPHGPDFFKATGCDTDQWCEVAKDAGMKYILFLTKHHDGFCLWNTKTTNLKVTNSPLGIDVLAKLHQSCDKYGLKLALYYSEGDWTWPGSVPGHSSGPNPEVEKAQLKELLTHYGPVEFLWLDHAQGDGGLSHADTDRFVYQFQPECFPGYNHGDAAGRIRLGEPRLQLGLGHASGLYDTSGAGYNSDNVGYTGYLLAEFCYPILPYPHEGGAIWFYSLPKYDNLCLPAEKIYADYLDAVKYGNLFDLDVSPNYVGRLRDIDVKTLRKLGQYIRGELSLSTKTSSP